MEVVRYTDRADLRERRRDELNEFPEYLNHNAMSSKYWGASTRTSRRFSSRSSTATHRLVKH